jgi:hypothetical protein
MAFPENDARWAFYKFAEENQHQAFFKHLGGPQLLAGNQYVRTLPLLDLIEYYLRKPLGLPAAHEAEREVMEMFFELPEEERENLGVVQEVWSGRLPIVWVTDRALCGPPQCPAGEVGDRLGLYGLKACKLVSIIYPSDFDRARSFVPTTLDAPFGAVFYLSVTPASGWGLTCSLTPSYTGVRERVHESFAGGLSEEFELLYVGPVEVDPKPDFDHLMMQGLIRVQ